MSQLRDHISRVLNRLRRTGIRRMSPLDRQWVGHWSAILVGPAEVPSADELRSLLLRYLDDHPTSLLGSTAEMTTGRWVAARADARVDHVNRLIRVADEVDLNEIPEYVERYRPPIATNLPFVVVLGPESMCFYLNHVFGDAATGTDLIFSLISQNIEGLAKLERRATMIVPAQALLRQSKATYRSWLDRARAALGGPAATAVAPRPGAEPPLETVPAPPRPGAASLVISNAEVRSLTKWRNAHCPGASITAVLTSRVYTAFAAEGIELTRSGFYSLFDIRSYLELDSSGLWGNLAKALFLEADLTDPRAVDEAMREIIHSRRALPGTVAGGVLTALRPPRLHPEMAAAGAPVLTFNSMPGLPGLESVPWIGTGARRYFGLGYPTGPTGISVFAIRLRDRMEITASFDLATVDPAAASRALQRLTSDPEPLNGRGDRI